MSGKSAGGGLPAWLSAALAWILGPDEWALGDLEERERSRRAGGRPTFWRLAADVGSTVAWALPRRIRQAWRMSMGERRGELERKRKREVRMRPLIGGIRRDVHFALRGLVRSPGFTLVAVLMLGLGTGAVTAVFSVVNASILRALPFEDGDDIVFLRGAYAAPEGPAIRGASPPEARDWEELSRSFSDVSVADGTSFTLTGNGAAEVIPAERVDEGYFELLHVQPALGRSFTQNEYRVPGTHFVTILSHDLWTRRYSADPAVVGRSITLNGRPWMVVGVLPPGFGGTTLGADLFVPLATLGLETLANRGDRYLDVVARLAPRVSVEDAQADMHFVASRLEAAYPDDHEDRIAVVTPARDVYLGTTRTLMLVILGGAGLLLVITVANIANLLLVKATAREGEVVVRRALGAGRRQLLGQFITESLVLSAMGAAAGLLLGVWGARGLTAAMPEPLLPAFVEVRPDATVFLVVTGLMTLVGLGVGLAPGLAAVRDDVAGALRAHGRGGVRSSSRLQSALVIGEIAAAVLLLVSGGLMARSLRAQLEVDPGYDFEALYGFSVFLPEERYAEDEVRPALERLLAMLKTRPEVAQATLMSDLPLRSGSSATPLWIGEDTTDENRIRIYQHRVGSDWFETMGIRLVSGRPIQAADSETELPVMVVSEAFADRYFSEDPLGQSILLPRRTDRPFMVVGVAEDVRYRDLTSDIRGGLDDPDVYMPWEQFPVRSVSVALRPRAGDPGALAPVARQVTAEFDPLLPVDDVGPLADDLRSETAQARFGAILLAVFSVLALALSLIGLYGVLAFAVSRRKREIAVRIALGAERARVHRMVVGHGLRLAGMGLATGAALSVVTGRSLKAFLYGVEPLDLLTLVTVSALMAGTAALASWVPAVQATRVDPQQALREE